MSDSILSTKHVGMEVIDDAATKHIKPTIQKVAMGAKPDPYNFTVLRYEHTFDHTIVLAYYPGCLTFDGQKLMLLKGTYTEFETLDPHFLDEEYAVVARFIPTDIGWSMARYCALASHILTNNFSIGVSSNGKIPAFEAADESSILSTPSNLP